MKGSYITIMVSGLIIWAMSVTGCRVQKVDGIGRLDNHGFEQRMQQKGVTILDVRTPEEYQNGFITGAINLNVLDEKTFKEGIEPLDKNKKYLIYCRTGKRSMTAARLMKEQGFKHLFDLENGISKWQGPVTRKEN